MENHYEFIDAELQMPRSILLLEPTSISFFITQIFIESQDIQKLGHIHLQEINKNKNTIIQYKTKQSKK